MTIPMLDLLLQANGRLHTLVGNPKLCEFIKTEYRPRLTAQLREKSTNRGLSSGPRREKADLVKAFLDGPAWKEPPVAAFEFDALPESRTWFACQRQSRSAFSTVLCTSAREPTPTPSSASR